MSVLSEVHNTGHIYITGILKTFDDRTELFYNVDIMWKCHWFSFEICLSNQIRNQSERSTSKNKVL